MAFANKIGPSLVADYWALYRRFAKDWMIKGHLAIDLALFMLFSNDSLTSIFM